MRLTLSVFLLALPLTASAQAPQTALTKANVRLRSTPRSARSSASFFHVAQNGGFTSIAPTGAIRG